MGSRRAALSAGSGLTSRWSTADGWTTGSHSSDRRPRLRRGARSRTHRITRLSGTDGAPCEAWSLVVSLYQFAYPAVHGLLALLLCINLVCGCRIRCNSATVSAMFRYTQKDLSSITDFDLAWRWTDPKWNQFSTAELAQVRPLQPAKAAEAELQVIAAIAPIPLRIVLDTTAALCRLVDAGLAKTHDASGDVEDTRAWLQANLPVDSRDVCISWGKATAVLAPLDLFVRYWDDFCYPMSDHVIIFPAELDWFLYWHHEEIVFLWRRSEPCHYQVAGPVSHPAVRAYEAQLSTWPACVNRSVTKGRVELPCLYGTTF